MIPMSRVFSGEPGPGPTTTAEKHGRSSSSNSRFMESFCMRYICDEGITCRTK